MSDYTAKDIQVLEGLEAVRRKTAMYLGDASSMGLHHALYEVIDNSVDEAMAGYATEIYVTLCKDGSASVLDNGRGVPVDIHPQKKVPAAELVFSTLHAGGKFDNSETGNYKISGGTHGVGAAATNATASQFYVYIRKDKACYELTFEKGKLIQNLTSVADKGLVDFNYGTYIKYMPDNTVFDTVDFDLSQVIRRVRENAFLNKGLSLTVKDERVDEEVTYCFPQGIKDYVQSALEGRSPVSNEPFYLSTSIAVEGKQTVLVEIALQYTDSYQETIKAYANGVYTSEGGTHLNGFKSILTKLLNEYGKSSGLLKGNNKLEGSDTREGIIAIISVGLPEVSFGGQTKSALANPEAQAAVITAMQQSFTLYLDKYPKIAKEIINKSLTAKKARDAARAARETVRKSEKTHTATLPGKLTDCSSKDPRQREIFLIEGDSAGGTAKAARKPEFQAILPLKGKVLNVEKARFDRILQNQEIISLINAFGTGIKDDFDINKLRYHKICIMTDADVDGSHIRALLLTFVYRLMPQLIEQGHLFIVRAPLFKVTLKGNKSIYIKDKAALDKYMTKYPDKVKEVVRMKGLGEMQASWLEETCMNPATRNMVKVTIEDAVEADRLMSTLMGNDAAQRKELLNGDSVDDSGFE